MQSGVEASLACALGVLTVEGMGGTWRIEYYVDEFGRAPFRRWVDGLPALQARLVWKAVADELTMRGPDVCADHWGRNLGGGLYECRIRRQHVVLRVFFCTNHGRVVVLLGGFDKGSQPKRQAAAIAVARQRLADYRRRIDSL